MRRENRLVWILVSIRHGIQKTLEVWCFLCCTAILGIIVYQVSARYFAHKPLLWAQGTCQLLLAHIVFLGTAMAFANRSHIAIDLVVTRLPSRGRRVMELSVTLFANLLLAFFAYCLYLLILSAHGVYPSPTLPKWIFYLPIFLGALLSWVIVGINFFESLICGSPQRDMGNDA